MHIPGKFKQDNIEQLVSVMEQYSFATLISYDDGEIEATHLPMLLEQVEERFVLKAHIAKANPLWKKIKNSSDVLVIFNGPNCYVSPNHYPTKAKHGRAVPTWNYVVVHVKGSITFKSEPKWLFNVIDQLTVKHEADLPNSWSISDAPEDYIKKMLPAIIGIEVEVNAIEGQWKLSQNQPKENQQGVVKGLSSSRDSVIQQVAAFVKAEVD